MDVPLRTFLACPGLGHINRGYETFTRESFEALRRDDRLEVFLFKGAGPAADHEKAVWCLRRSGRLARGFGRLLGRSGYDAGYYTECLTFVAGLLPHLVRLRPRVVYFSDPHVGSLLWHWRRLTRSRFKLLVSNGGPIGPPGFPRFDHVHQVSAIYFDESTASGRTADTQTLLPYGFQFDAYADIPTPEEQSEARRQLNLPTDRQIVLAVGALNRSHKRTDYVVQEVAALPEPRPFLVLLGQFEVETPGILAEAAERLGTGGFIARTVAASEVSQYYRVADAFALGSIHEGFGRVYVEAAAHGLRCVAHEGPVQRYVLGRHGRYGNFTVPGSLTSLLSTVLNEPVDPTRKSEQYQDFRHRFGWDELAGKYVDMIVRCAGQGTAKRIGIPNTLQTLN